MTCPSSSLSLLPHPPSPAALRSIRCLRNIIHWNLISAFILRNATWFVVQLTMSPEVHQSNVVCPGGPGLGSEEGSRWDRPGGGGAGPGPGLRAHRTGAHLVRSACREEAPGPRQGAAATLTRSPGSPASLGAGGGRQAWCRLVTAAYNYLHVTNFFWMFGEGCYLHTAVVLTYSTDRLRKWMFICIGWGERPSPPPHRPGCPLLTPTQASRLQGQVRVTGCAPQPSAPPGCGGSILEAYWTSGSELSPGNPCLRLGSGLHWGPPGPAPPRLC